MSRSSHKRPNVKKYSEGEIEKFYTEYYGMLSGLPASEIPTTHAEKNVNLIDHRQYSEVRPGSYEYTEYVFATTFTADSSTDQLTTTREHAWDTADPVYVLGDDLPEPLEEDTEYWVVNVDANTIKLASSRLLSIYGSGINLTDNGSGTLYVYHGEMNARVQHRSQDKVVMQLGREVYISDPRLTSLVRAINISKDRLSGISSMDIIDQDVIIVNSSGVYKLPLDIDDSNYVMFRMNSPLPNNIITDQNESDSNIYGYHVIYSWLMLSGSGNRSRTSDSVEILAESGTSLLDGQEKDYGEVFYSSAIGEDISVEHSYGNLKLPNDSKGATHYGLYRTKNIGINSGGVSDTVDGMGNSPAQMVWVADVPIAKIYKIDSFVSGTDLDIDSGSNDPEVGEVGNSIRLYSSTFSELPAGTTIVSVDEDARTITMSTSWAPGVDIAWAIVGYNGNYELKCSQVGTTLTCTTANFTDEYLGQRIFYHDGSSAIIKTIIDLSNVIVTESKTITDELVILGFGKSTADDFSRVFNDTVPDNSEGDGRISLNDRILSGQDLYIPRRYFKPLPESNMCMVGTGYLIVANRDGGKIYYSQIGDKVYSMGFYKPFIQEQTVESEIRQLVKMPDICVALGSSKTKVLALDTAVNVGRTDIGENVFQLRDLIQADEHIGVIAWQSIAFKTSSLFFAVTNEPAIRTFDGVSWSKQNYAIDMRTGQDAVQKFYVDRIDLGEAIVGAYTSQSGYVIWATRWVEE